MAQPGNGLRRAVDVLAEVSYHLVEPVLNATITQTGPAGFGDGGFGYNGDITDGGGFGFGVGNYAELSVPVEFYLYPGALIVVGYRTPNEEVVTVTSIDPSTNSFTANFTKTHAPGDIVFSATFPTQETSDPLYTQVEALSYLARAQNEFLSRVPMIFQFFPNQALTLGFTLYPLPATAIEVERVAVQVGSLDFAITSISRTGNVVTATTQQPSLFTPGLKVYVSGVTDTSFNSIDTQTTSWFTILTVSADGLTLTWAQTAANASSTGGDISLLLFQRAYESSQEQFAMRDPWWLYNQESEFPTSWYEDRTGVYQWGVAPQPRAAFFAELICSVRDTTTLALTDGFLVPDIFIPYIKYKTLQWMLSKEGEQRSPTLAKYCQQRFDFGVSLSRRFLRNMVEPVKQGA